MVLDQADKARMFESLNESRSIDKADDLDSRSKWGESINKKYKETNLRGINHRCLLVVNVSRASLCF
jgi:hypothetical protein